MHRIAATRVWLPAIAAVATAVTAAITVTTAITAATAAAPASTAATTTAAVAAAAAATTPSASSRLALLGLVHTDRSSIQLGAVELLDRRLGIRIGSHLDESKAARAASVTVGHDAGTRHGPAVLLERRDQIIFLRVPGQVAHEESLAHKSHSTTRRGVRATRLAARGSSVGPAEHDFRSFL